MTDTDQARVLNDLERVRHIRGARHAGQQALYKRGILGGSLCKVLFFCSSAAGFVRNFIPFDDAAPGGTPRNDASDDVWS